MTIIENCALNGVNRFLFHLVLVVEHAHKFVEMRDLLARITMILEIVGNVSTNASCLGSTIMSWSLTRTT